MDPIEPVPQEPVPQEPVDVSALGAVDLGTLGALARRQLQARREGREIRLLGAGAELLELLELTGLTEVLLGVEPGREAEQGEQGVGVEEGVEPGDPAG
jgi:anti-anti-sigma regulatory factor